MGSAAYWSNQHGRGSPSSLANSAVDLGLSALVLRVSGYNGIGDDTALDVEWLEATRIGLTGDDDGGAASGVPSGLNWDGKDVWLALQEDPRSDADPTVAKFGEYVASAAYVTDQTLVARFSRVETPGGTVSQAVVVANIERSDDGWALRDGTFAGRLPSDQQLTQLNYQLGDDLQVLCTDSPGYADVKDLICSLVDVNSAGVDDGSAPCDASSWAFRFEADPIRLGGTTSPDVLPQFQACPDPARLPSHDTCGTVAP